jgi:hypothetical protein
MKTKLSLIIVVCFAGTLSFGQNPNPNQNPKQQAMKQAAEQAANTPINFWGKVVDQNGNPIAGATATFSLPSSSFSEDEDSTTKIVVLSDANGLFSLIGKTGAGISVWVSKEGYYSVPDEADAGFLDYFRKSKYPQTSFNRAGTWQPFPTEQQPTIFTLTKKGQPAANLIHKFIRVPIPKDGTPVDIDLTQGRIAPAGQGDLQVQTWVTDNGKDVVHPFAWKCLVKVLGGGLQARAGKLDFHAPSSGYQPQEQVAMGKDDEHWKKGMHKQYFLQLSSNRYARVRFEMVNGGNNLLNLDYFLNPTPGDTNLESAKWSAAD